ncbi:DNA-binding transcriptional regulator, LysR family [Streptococcus henryi]|jgi:DNA-binding transcriptional LysR family regulator|uniref:DNA-binding transcriptional regulator, LysR family n=1 Tax=Streptococcus henryi TaxID=439219 RepID=A0A1G6C173_9STRE|nr:LysR family transcriptional regulator [Streptococcus henryi]SDB26621.1 DNA-binding transcriptional regulator, LysR family [Streptococcus henryi]
MNIQQLRYVVAIANSGTFREAASKLFVSQPSLSVAVRDLEGELGFQIFTRTTTGAVLTSQGLAFYEKALEVVKSFDSFERQFSQSNAENEEFSIASQHYDFLPPLITAFSKVYSKDRNFRIFESTTIRILDEVAQGDSEIGIIYLNNQNRKGLLQRMEKLGLEYVELIPFQTHIYLGKQHNLASKAQLKMTDLLGLPTVRFTQEKEDYLYYSENFVDTTESSRIFNVTDRATLNGILERTDAYATGSGFLDSRSVNGITVIPLEDDLDNKMVYIKRRDKNLSSCALQFIGVMTDYFAKFSPKRADKLIDED